MITLALLYLRIGLIFFGGGYVLIPLLQETLVHHYGWLTQREFIDGLAISQLTPGPLAMLATFTGVRIGGVWGGTLATICIFLPCVIFMLLVGRYYERLRQIDLLSDALNAILPAVVGLIAAAAFTIGSDITQLWEWGIGLVGFTLFRTTKISPMLLILGAALIGALT
jgi:chromate transporter